MEFPLNLELLCIALYTYSSLQRMTQVFLNKQPSIILGCSFFYFGFCSCSCGFLQVAAHCLSLASKVHTLYFKFLVNSEQGREKVCIFLVAVVKYCICSYCQFEITCRQEYTALVLYHVTMQFTNDLFSF